MIWKYMKFPKGIALNSDNLHSKSQGMEGAILKILEVLFVY